MRALTTPEREARGLYWGRLVHAVEGCEPADASCRSCWLRELGWMHLHNPNPTVRARYEGVIDAKGQWCDHRTYVEAVRVAARRRKPQTYMVLSDLGLVDIRAQMHEIVSFFWGSPQHTWLVCTKRPEKLGPRLRLTPLALPPNVWVGVTVPETLYDWRLADLAAINAEVRYLSYGPALGPLDLNRRAAAESLDWVIVECESGAKRRPMELGWAREVVEWCRRNGKPVWVKQVEIDGRVSTDPAEWPEDLRVRELPKQAERRAS